MKYDFTTIIDRRGKDALAVDLSFADQMGLKLRDGVEPIPMWVADMNFATCPAIVDAIVKRAQHPLYGYFSPRQEYFDAIIKWQKDRNGVAGLSAEHIGYENGVLGGVLSALAAVCSRGDNVLLHTPTYIGFNKSLKNAGYNMLYSPLKRDGDGVWRMDFEDMERQIVENRVHALLFCSPHNPTGRVWERPELERMVELCEKHQVFIVSDEIWSDLICPGRRHIPVQSVSGWAREHTAAMYAPSKTFNLAGLIGSYHIIYDRWLRDRVDRESAQSHYNNMNVLSMHALIGAYSPEGQQWCDELRQVLAENLEYGVRYIREHFEGVEVAAPEGTYMLFLDCKGWLDRHGKTIDQLQAAGIEAGVTWQDGRQFNGPTHVRMNLASPGSRVVEAFDRLDKYVFNAE